MLSLTGYGCVSEVRCRSPVLFLSRQQGMRGLAYLRVRASLEVGVSTKSARDLVAAGKREGEKRRGGSPGCFGEERRVAVAVGDLCGRVSFVVEPKLFAVQVRVRGQSVLETAISTSRNFLFFRARRRPALAHIRSFERGIFVISFVQPAAQCPKVCLV